MSNEAQMASYHMGEITSSFSVEIAGKKVDFNENEIVFIVCVIRNEASEPIKCVVVKNETFESTTIGCGYVIPFGFGANVPTFMEKQCK